MDSWIEAGANLIGEAQQRLFEHLLQPLMLMLGLDGQLEAGYVGALWLLAGLAQIALMVVVLRPLERWRPAEPAAQGPARAEVRTDIAYTLLHRLGLFRALLFISVEPLWDRLLGLLRLQGLPTFHLDAVWPGVSDQAWVSFLLYLVAFDALAWCLHWLQHHWGWWWRLHALHHSQRHMTLWSDNRNHLLDDLITDSVLVFAGLLIGVPPAQFIAVVAVTQLLESLSHANLRASFGPVIGHLLVSPQFHRTHHHMVLEGAADLGASARGCNYGVLLPVWDVLAGTARFGVAAQPTGVLDQLPEHGGRDYGRGFWAQQWLGLRRLLPWGRA